MFLETSDSICACASLRRASRAICHLYDLVLAPTGIKATQFIILNVILQAGAIAHCDLARLFAASEETFSRRLASARRAGWVKMTVDARRRRVYSLTEEGRQVVEEAMPYWERAQDRMRRELGELDWSVLGGFAERVTRAAIRAEAAPSRNRWPDTADRTRARAS
ncbi:MAG TPA: MarR family winged helix-turn-helix transcriptional regulator [Acidobacteriaceae bacterium]|jgi:DNA-binding MarR family transcriptional regulator|nr:MarR family winged helix-turn-helix transcriptional regulator [Acidobacteriaceae bacterium]